MEPIADGDNSEPGLEPRHWYSRGVGLSAGLMLALAEFGGAYSGEVSVPVHQEFSATARASRMSLLGGNAISFIGYQFQAGVRWHRDVVDSLILTIEAAATYTKGRTFRPGGMASREKRVHVRYWGTVLNVGSEIGGSAVRFYWEFVVQLSQAHLQTDIPALFLGLTIGLRVYLPVTG